MKNLIPIENEPGYAIDPNSGAFINIDKTALFERKYKKELHKKIEIMQAEINNLKNEIEILKKKIGQ